jgi:hypothetical protein
MVARNSCANAPVGIKSRLKTARAINPATAMPLRQAVLARSIFLSTVKCSIVASIELLIGFREYGFDRNFR